MLKTPTIPTDNLYKFMALSGVFSAVVLIVTMQLTLYNLMLKTSELNGLTKILKEEKDSLKKKDSIQNEKVERFTERYNELTKTLLVHQTSLDYFISFKNLGYLMIIIFICQSIWGFMLWYHRLQKYQDEMLKREAEESNLK